MFGLSKDKFEKSGQAACFLFGLNLSDPGSFFSLDILVVIPIPTFDSRSVLLSFQFTLYLPKLLFISSPALKLIPRHPSFNDYHCRIYRNGLLSHLCNTSSITFPEHFASD